MSSSVHANYLLDLGTLLKEAALQAKADALKEADGPDHQFALGRQSAYCAVLSLMQGQAIAFGIELADVSLQDFNPERDLL